MAIGEVIVFGALAVTILFASLKMLTARFEVRPGFNAQEYLKDSWGIIQGELVTVRVIFQNQSCGTSATAFGIRARSSAICRMGA